MILTWWIAAKVWLLICLPISSFPSATQSWHVKQLTVKISLSSAVFCEIPRIFPSSGKSSIKGSFRNAFIFSYTDFCWCREHYSSIDYKVDRFWSIWCPTHCSYFKRLHIDAIRHGACCCFWGEMTSSNCFPNAGFFSFK